MSFLIRKKSIWFHGWKRNKIRDAIALLRVISEKAIDHCKDVFVAFVDYEKAFDRVHWPKLMEVLAKIGVDYRDRKMIWNLYMNQTASVKYIYLLYF